MDDTVQIDVGAIRLVRVEPFEPTRLEQSLIDRLKTSYLARYPLRSIPVTDSDICETVLELGANSEVCWNIQWDIWLCALEDMIEGHNECMRD